MTRSVFVICHPTLGPLNSIVSDTKESAWMALYADMKAPSPLSDAHIAAMSEYAADHKAAQEWLRAMGYRVVAAKLKVEEGDIA